MENDIEVVGFSFDEVYQLFERLLSALPELKHFDWIEKNAGFSYSAIKAMKSKLGDVHRPFTAKKLTSAVYPLLDLYSWDKSKPHLEEIIRHSKSNQFSYQSMTEYGTLWWHVTMGFLSSQNIKFTGYAIFNRIYNRLHLFISSF